MYMVISYDIEDDKRRTRIHRILKNFGQWVQYSLFECQLTRAQYLHLRHRLDNVIHKTKGDKLRFYFLCARAQSTTIGTGTFTSVVYGPANTIVVDSAYNRHIYIYPSTLLGGLKHGDTINSLEFRRNGTTALSGKVNMKILLKMTDSADLGTTTVNWLLESLAPDVVLVYDKDPTGDVGSTNGFVKFGFNKNKFEFDTSKGENLQIFIQYTQTTAITAPRPRSRRRWRTCPVRASSCAMARSMTCCRTSSRAAVST